MTAPANKRLVSSTTFLLIGLGRLLRGRLEEALESDGLTMRHMGALGHLRATPGMSVSDLAKRAGITPQSMHATVKELITRGAVQSAAKGQGRRAELSITAEGERLLARAFQAAADIDAEVFLDGGASLRGAAEELLKRLLRRD